jgi:hypothetical protein
LLSQSNPRAFHRSSALIFLHEKSQGLYSSPESSHSASLGQQFLRR